MKKFTAASFVPYVTLPALIAAGTALVFHLAPDISNLNLVMLYLLANVLIAMRYGQGPVIVTTLFSIAAFDYYFIPPRFGFYPSDISHFLTFAIMLVVILITSYLTIQFRKSAKIALAAELRAEQEGMISSLLSTVSHDLRTPLTAVSAAADTMRRHGAKLPAEDRDRLLEIISSESSRLNRLVENVLQMTKIEAGGGEARKELHSLEAIIGGVLSRMESSLQGRTIETALPEDLPLVPLDSLLIEQVVSNLLENVVRHTPDHSPVRISASQSPEGVRVEISDRGPGIPHYEREKVFEKFHRCGKQDGWGSGLGLAICRGVIKAHGGRIGVQDNPGGGSIFFFNLPLAAVKSDVGE